MADKITELPEGASSPSIADNFKKVGITPPVTPAKTTPTNSNSSAPKPESKNPDNVIDWEAKAKALEVEMEDLKKNPKVVTVEKILTPEDIQAKAAEERKDFVNYVVLDKKLPAIDLEKYEQNQSLSARDFLFEEYKAEVLAEDPDTLPNELQNLFEAEYGLGTTDEKALNRANRKMEIEATAKKAEKFKAFSGLQDEFKTVKSVKAKVIEYNKLVADTKPDVTLSIQIEGYNEPVEIVVDYTDMEDSLTKELLTRDAFQSFTRDGVDTQKAIAEFIQETVEKKKRNKIIAEIATKLVQKKIAELKIGSIAPADTPGGSNTQQVKNFGFSGIQKQIDANK